MSRDIPLAGSMADQLPSLEESIAYLESREDFQQAKAEYQVYLEERKPKTPAQRTEHLDSLPLPELVKLLDDQLPFDLVIGITDFLQELGAFIEPERAERQDNTEEDAQTRYVEESLIDAADLDLLASVLPPALASKLARSPHIATNVDPSALRISLLNTLARLALSPPLTIPIARSFRPIFIDLASRWLLLLGFNGTGFQASHANTTTFVRVLAALARTLPEFPQLYPILLLALQHPHLQAESIAHLLARDATMPTDYSLPSSAINPSPTRNDVIYHPELAQLLLTFYALLVVMPHLPLLRTIRQHIGGPAPPDPVGDVLSSHPQMAMRTLAWHVATMWLGWSGPHKEVLRRKYVYDPALDARNGSEGRLKSDVPLRGSDDPFRPEEWLSYWPRLPEHPFASLDTARSLKVRLEVPQADAWILDERLADLSRHEWSIERSRNRQDPSSHAGDGSMALDALPTKFTCRVAEVDQCPLLAQVAGMSLLKEAFIASTTEQGLQTGRALEHAQTTSTLPQIDVFVPTSTSIAALRQLAIHVAARIPVLLSSPPSAGKATTLQELHRLLYEVPSLNNRSSRKPQDIVTINLADKSLDAKNLLGSLTSSPTEPGAFVFAEGSLTRALRYGRWLVLEDIDKASDEVLSTISELVERIRNRAQEAIGGGWGGLAVNGVGVQAGGEWVPASENFMIFATRSFPTSAVQAQSQTNDSAPPLATFFGSQYWSHVWMETPDLAETKVIMEGRFPRLAKEVVEGLVQTWARIAEISNSIYSTSSTGLARTIGLRDLVKWCRRVEQSLPGDIPLSTFAQNPRFQDEVFLDARDIFLRSFPARNVIYDAILEELRTGLDLSQERLDWALQSRVPEVTSNGEKPGSIVHYGRVSLAKGKFRQSSTAKRPYALTKPFLLLLEELAAAVKLQEPVLLVGETGTGKTTAITQLAEMLGHKLTALNLSNQTEASDLLGGFKPINEAEEVARRALELVNQFTDLFAASFEASRNIDYGIAVQKAYKKKRWSRLAGLFREAAGLAETKLSRNSAADSSSTDGPRKKRKTFNEDLIVSWTTFKKHLISFESLANEAASKSSKFKFTFVEGPLTRALREGEWVLLDEVNLATSETLESLSSLLQSTSSSLVLTERGDLEPVHRHPNFRIFACMNPATDVGKRDLPPALRVKFTEIFVAAPDADKEALLSVIHGYIGHVAVGDRGVVQDIAELYLTLKGLSQAGRIADGSNHPPHFSMRTLARSLVFTADFAREYGTRRAAYEGISMCFTTSLDASSKEVVLSVMHDCLVERSKSPRSFFKTVLQPPQNVNGFVSVGTFWLAKGNQTPQPVEDYVLTASVEDKLISLARAIAAARFPILLQGPTSSGKTSIIEYLAKRSGHNFVRINNHEHTDIQEYLGTYTSDAETGKLVFQEGLLVKAVREGHWIVLDELNLAPTDVLEALNRLLDDNRELIIPETHEVVKPHPHFMLFATQNPPGLYGGRKVLSRAFRNRFLEMQFSDVPQEELEIILCQRCRIAPSYAKKIVAVFLELQRRRQNTRLFEEKQAFVTLRDLFRWGNRGAVGYEQLALDGYMLLAERTRTDADKETVREVIEQVMKVSLVSLTGYETLFDNLHVSNGRDEPLVWTTAMKRLYVLIRTALSFDEPVLLVGETGSGKTSVCQAIADGLGRELHIVNCHQNTETSDLIGSQRPVRNKKAIQEALRLRALEFLDRSGTCLPGDNSFNAVLTVLQNSCQNRSEGRGLLQEMLESEALFAWHDGPLIEAMRHGDMLLLDEISLADDSVLERLNSVLEPARTLTIAEKGSKHSEDARIQAHRNFQIIGTMNPGGDFGKKELSPALRNRFTEIWVPWLSREDDILGILCTRLGGQNMENIARRMVDFAKWFTEQVLPRESYSFGSVVSLRDLLAWADFLTSYQGNKQEAFVHGALMTLVDALGSTSHTSGLRSSAIIALRERSLAVLESLIFDVGEGAASKNSVKRISWTGEHVFDYFLARLTRSDSPVNTVQHFSFSAPTVRLNTLRVMRALQVPKPILLEGSPGVGKTSLVTALAQSTNRILCRINLSDQTDLVDLFGSDSPVEGGKAGEFAWVDAPFLSAMQAGHWVLLDEMNLASQSVLEGLNSCLDHRGTVYIPELDKVFSKHPEFRIFAAQNPTNQGGSRKGLPRSFVDRFTQVYMDDLDETDYFDICCQLHPSIDPLTIRKMVTFVVRLAGAVGSKTGIFSRGSPWEVNLRDLLRWLSMMTTVTGYERHAVSPAQYLDVLFVQRFREPLDQEWVVHLFEDIFGSFETLNRIGRPVSTSTSLRIGPNVFPRLDPILSRRNSFVSCLGNSQLRPLEALSTAVANNQLLIITGPSSSGKSAVIHTFAALTGRTTRTFHANAQTDTLEMLGSFEQHSRVRRQFGLLEQMQSIVDSSVVSSERAVGDDWRAANSISREVAHIHGIDPVGYSDSIDKLRLSLQASTLRVNLADFVGALAESQNQSAEAGRFEFVDGVLIEAMVAGDILVIENANRCNPAVLDRLNGLFEPGGKLVLSERGLAPDGRMLEIQPHPNFRVIMTLDPRAGELSRAMRNRGIEIALADQGHRPAYHDRLSQQIRSLTLSRLQTGTAEHKANDAVRSARSELDRAHLVHELGSTTVTSLPLLQRRIASNNTAAVLQKALENPVWSMVQTRRPGQISGDLPGQSHAVSFFALDTNEALKDRPLNDMNQQLALDNILTGLVDLSICHFHSFAATRSSLSRPVAALTVLEQAYLHSEYPARLPTVHKGVESIRPLQTSLLGVIEKVIAESATTDPCSSATFVRDMTTCLDQLLTIFASHELNYTLYQALLAEIRMRLSHVESSSNLGTSREHLMSAITLAEDSVKRSSGHSLEAIWTYVRKTLPLLPAELASLGECGIASLPIDLSELYMDVVKAGLQCESVQDASLLAGLHHRISALKGISRDTSFPPHSDALVSISELSTVAQSLRLESTRSSLPRIVSRIGHRSLSSLTPILRQLADPSRPPMSMMCEWLDTVVSQSHPNLNSPIVEALLTDMELRGSLDVALFSRQAPLSGLSATADMVAIAGQAHFELAAAPKPERRDSLAVLALAILVESLRAIGAPATSLEGVDYTDVVVVLENVLAQLSLRTEPGTSALCDALQDLGAQHGHSACLPALSRVYVCLARWFWSLYVPDIPLDPLLSSQALRSLYERETANLVAEAAIEDEATRSPGGRGARRLEVVTYRLKILEQCLKVTHAGVRQGESSHESLMALFTELRACTTVLLGSDVLLAISEGTETVPRPQLENLQTSLVAIHTRLKTFYTAYSDLVKPITLALGSAALGLGISISVAKEAHRVQTASTITDITAKLITWPSLASSRHLPEIALPTSISADVPAPIPPASGPLLTLRAIAATRVDYTEHLGVRTLQQICAAYEKVFTLWTIDRKRAEQERLQSESIYRSRRQDVEIASEAAQEEADLRSLFPTFDGEGEGQAQIRSAPNAKTLLRYDDLRSIYETHTQLFSPRGSKDLLQATAQRALIGEKRLLLEQLHNSFPDLISEKVDFYASPTALQILAEVANSFSQEKATQSADFYHDANILEAGKLCNLLQGGLQRLDELISAWPEQMVLVELADRCKALLAVPSTSPLAKLVAFVESLLLKMTDWEAYASRETSLSGFSTPLTALVVDWRRLELKSWAALLDNQEREFRDPISEWWFRMYELCIQGPIALSAKDAVKTSEPDNEYLDTLLNMLRTFVEQTPAGQFRDKLYLIESFGRLTAMLEADSPVFARISSALFNLSSLYEPQALRIDTFLREEKKKIVNDVNEVIRLASWKDVNVYALKASAQKSHRQLYKRVRALRRVLETPSLRFEDDTKVTNLEDSHASLTMRQPPMPVASLHEGFTPLRALCDVPLAKPLLNIEATLSRLMKIVQDDDSVHASAPSDRHLRILVDSILSRSKDLQAEQPSGTTKDEREKQSKALMDRKRKAWSSLLAEAKRIGLSPRPSTMLVQNLSRMASLFNTAPLSNDSSRILAHFGPVLTILDKYFYRMCLLMPRVRSAASQHHPDVDPSQLQAAAGHLDSAFNAAHASRSAISREVHDISITTQAYQKLLVLREHGVATEQLTSPRDSMHALHSCLFYLEAALGESLQSCDDHSQFMTDAEKPAVMQVTGTLRESINEIRASKNEAEAALTEYGNVAPLALSHCHTIHRALRAWKDVGDRLSSAARIAPQMAYLLAPILTWMAKAGKELQWDTAAPALDADDASLSAVQAYATAMSAVLVSIQTLQDQSLPQFEEDGGYAKGGLTIHQKTLVDRIRTLHTASISQHVRALMEKIAELSKHGSGIPLASQLIDRSLPFLSSYLRLAENHVASLVAWNRALLKFMYIFARTTLTLANEGFCRPLESDDDAPGEANNFEGTGMGTGEGSKNVSDQIENEEQVEGLEDQPEGESPDDQNDKAGKDEMLDMEEDFGGKMQDVDERESNEASDNDDNEDKEDEDHLDEELGKVNPLDPTAVDDKFWDDKDDEQHGEDKSPPPEEQSRQNAGAKDNSAIGERQESNQPEDRDEQDDNGNDAKGDEAAVKHEPTVENEDQEDLPGEENEETPDDHLEGEETRRQELPEVDMDQQALDLPDDLDLDPHIKDQQEDEIDDELEADQTDADKEANEQAEENLEDVGEHQQKQEEEEEGTAEVPPQEREEDFFGADDPALTHESAGNEEGSGDNVHKAQGASGMPESGNHSEEPAQSQTAQDNDVEQDVGQEQAEAAEQRSTNDAHGTSAWAGEAEGGQAGAQTAPNQPGDPSQISDSAMQDEKQLGDAAQAFMRRLEAISQATDKSARDGEQTPPEKPEIPAEAEVEYIREGEEETGLQATGAADQEMAEKTGFEPADPDLLDDLKALDLDQSKPAEDQVLQHHIPPAQMASDRIDLDEALGTLQRDGRNEQGEQISREQDQDDFSHGINETDALNEDKRQTEFKLQHWLADGRESLPSEEVWRLYTSMTRDLSFSLTESLRLVLEPTLATRLKGDYRTGKRLNMRKIIPYIASDYTKDKIWLRRTRPSQREYQVLLALDDSRSMADSRAVHLAYQTLALVCQSLTKLEVGEVSICKFGQQTNFIHNFEDGSVSDTAGARIVDSFQFAQTSTDVKRLLENSLERFQIARDRRGGSAADLWQLEIIISDGMCQDLEDIRSLLRKARLQKIMVMFVVLDSLHSSNGASKGSRGDSILSLKSVSYQKSKSGALELKMERYMDTFPFEYYVVLRDVEALPEVLGETLRQFFDKVRGDNS